MHKHPGRISWALLGLAVGSIALLSPSFGEQDERAAAPRRGRWPRWSEMSEQERAALQERMRQRRQERERDRAERLRKTLELTEEEYTVIGSRVEAIQRMMLEQTTVSRSSLRDLLGGPDRRGNRRGRPDRSGDDAGQESAGPRHGDRGGRERPPFGRGARELSEHGRSLQSATEKLRDVLDDKEAPADDVKSALAELRNARKTMDAAVSEAREELRGLLTSKQEAMLVMMMVLD